jgi:hypothetical protein
MKRLVSLYLITFLAYCSKSTLQFPWRNYFINSSELAGTGSKTWNVEQLKVVFNPFGTDSSGMPQDSNKVISTSKDFLFTFFKDGRLKVTDSVASILGIDTLLNWRNASAGNGNIIEQIVIGESLRVDVVRYYYKTGYQNEIILLSGELGTGKNIRLINLTLSAN